MPALKAECQEVEEAQAEARRLEALARPAPAMPGPARSTWSESELAARWARGRALNLAEARAAQEVGQ